MFKQGQTYKVKLELSPDRSGFGRATIISKDNRSLCVALKNSSGANIKVGPGTKIWFVSGATDNRFNGVWYSEVESSKLVAGERAIICSMPKFQKQEQKRSTLRLELNVPASLLGYEWRSLNAKFYTKNISRIGIAFLTETDCAAAFKPGTQIRWMIKVDNIELPLTVKVVNSRFNWLLNRTELGAEFTELDPETTESLERVLESIQKTREAKKQLSESGSLARWVKAGKDNLGLVKAKQEPAEGEEAARQDNLEGEEGINDDDDLLEEDISPKGETENEQA
jgi:hypothetical protein